MRDIDEILSLDRPPIVLTKSDRDSLVSLICDVAAVADTGSVQFLREEIERADIAPSDVGPKLVVRMGSRVKFVDHSDERIRRATLVFPGEVTDDRCVSILSSVGSALIGLGPGQSIRWMEKGRERSLAVLEVCAGSGQPPCVQGRDK